MASAPTNEGVTGQIADDNNPTAPENQETEPERPEWLPSMFDTPEALAKSYSEATRKISEQGQEVVELRTQVEQYEAEKQQAAQPDQAEIEQQLVDAYNEDPIRTMNWLAQQAAQTAVAQYQQQTGQQTAQYQEVQNHATAYIADQIVGQRYDDWEQYKGKVLELITEDPDLLPSNSIGTPEQTARALERVYKLAKAEASYEQNPPGQPIDQGRLQKLQAQTMSGAAGRPDEPSNDEEWWARVQAAAKKTYSARMAEGESGR